jgi:hypothetical protein
MATYIDFDSSLRRISSYANPFDYVVEDDQVQTWMREPRKVTTNSAKQINRAIEYTQSLEIEGCVIPFAPITYTDCKGIVITTHTADLQRIYIDIHSLRYNDLRLIYSMDDKLAKARFVLTQHKVQNDSIGNPLWLQYKTNGMDQVMRFSRSEPVKITFMQEQGYVINIINPTNDNVISIDPKNQNWINLEVNPYFRDGDYVNHGLGLTQF